MHTPVNTFKQALRERRPQIGLWMGLASDYTAEICALAGFDWLVIDGEHSPNDLNRILAQLKTLAAYPGSHAVARVPVGETALIKQYLDLGAQNILVPMVDTAEQAAQLVRAMRYPQDDGQGGVRGMAGARASRWGHYADYFKRANEEVCLIVQVETLEALKNLDAIAATPGVDGVFIGPATCLPAWAMWAMPRTPRCRPPSKMRSPASSKQARPPASSRPTSRWRSTTWRSARCLWPWAWTRRS